MMIKNEITDMANYGLLADPVMCKHCGKPIRRALMIGFSLICPLCGKPQNGELHLVENTNRPF